MVFSSLTFLFAFLPLVVGLYFLCPRALRNLWLLIASLVFYSWGEGPFVLVMLVSITANWGFGLGVNRFAVGSKARRWVLGLGLAANLVLLGAYKYANFAIASANDLLAALGASWHFRADTIHLPVGISFFTFQAMSYLVDVYRGTEKAETSLVRVALFISLFPQLIAGPIVRYGDVAAQIRSRTTSLSDVAHGVERFVVGLAKKVLIANNAALIADQAFAVSAAELTPAMAWVGVLAYSLQIFFDFSGYSDMAVGLGRFFGFHFLENFRYPYVSRSITDFWRRWHISLSTWFRDYLYIPLGGNRCRPGRVYFNLWVVFLLCGLWHGASWNFVLWGAFHGLFLVSERALFKNGVSAPGTPVRRLLAYVAAHVYTLVAVQIAWVFFRAETVQGAAGYLATMFGMNTPVAGAARALADVITPGRLVFVSFGVLGCLPLVPALGQYLQRKARLLRIWELASVAVLMFLLFLSASSLASGTHNPFIYFRF